MFVFYEEDGAFKAATVLTDNTSSLQVEAAHGKRSKIKATAVLFSFKEPALAGFMEAAQAVADGMDLDFLWQCCGEDEFMFSDLALDYFGHAPNAVESAGLLLRLHSAPMYFYKKGRGKYKPATQQALQSALASEEKKRRQAEQVAEYVRQLTQFTLPPDFQPHLTKLLYAPPDKNTLEYKALEQACAATGMTTSHLLEKCGAIPSSHDYHLNRFLFDDFPGGLGFGAYDDAAPIGDLPLSDARAFSIDDETTTEIDDAFSVSRLANGNWRIGVHIAAPALGIAPDSTLDAIALERLSTVYMPGQKITMLPEKVIEDFTLQQGKPCPALTMYLEVTEECDIVASESLIERVNIAANLRHETLEPVFNETTLAEGGPDFPFKPEMELLWRFANKLEALRGKANGMGLVPDYNFKIDGEHVTISHRQRGTPIDKVVAELMILVNSRWAAETAQNGVTAIYRAQDNGKVRMTTVPAKHQGLGVAQYIWSSSPLRRYIDLINQRQLIAMVSKKPAPYAANSEALLGAMRSFELAYEAYNNFQRGMEKYWCLRYLLQEGITHTTASVIRENLVRMETMPLVVRAGGMPELAAGTVISVELSDIDLLELNFTCKYKPGDGM